MSNNHEVMNEIEKTAVNLLAVVLPSVDILQIVYEGAHNIANILLIDKIKIFLNNQNYDFEDRLKLSLKFNEDTRGYYENVKLMIHTINSMNDDEKIKVYANLTRAWLVDLLQQETLLRLSFVLSNIFMGDLLYLQANSDKVIHVNTADESTQRVEITNLTNHNLLYWNNEGSLGALAGLKTYRPTAMGLEMVRCGLDFTNYDKYKHIAIVGER